MRNVLLGLILFFIPSCLSFIDDSVFYCDPRAVSYLDAFIGHAKDRGIIIEKQDLIVVLTDVENATATSKYEQGFKKIEIDEAKWAQLMEFEKEIVLFHELGHLYLRREHINSYPSIMNANPIIVDYEINRSKYIDELFNQYP